MSVGFSRLSSISSAVSVNMNAWCGHNLESCSLRRIGHDHSAIPHRTPASATLVAKAVQQRHIQPNTNMVRSKTQRNSNGSHTSCQQSGNMAGFIAKRTTVGISMLLALSAGGSRSTFRVGRASPRRWGFRGAAVCMSARCWRMGRFPRASLRARSGREMRRSTGIRLPLQRPCL